MFVQNSRREPLTLFPKRISLEPSRHQENESIKHAVLYCRVPTNKILLKSCSFLTQPCHKADVKKERVLIGHIGGEIWITGHFVYPWGPRGSYSGPGGGPIKYFHPSQINSSSLAAGMVVCFINTSIPYDGENHQGFHQGPS
jgi:hypothetical protein